MQEFLEKLVHEFHTPFSSSVLIFSLILFIILLAPIFMNRFKIPGIIGLILSGMIIHEYQSILENFIILAMYMPMMAATGGNTGSQAATVVIRSLSLGEIEDKDWMKIIFKEAKNSM